MSNTTRQRLLVVASALFCFGLAIPGASAFNPQPDPPAKSKWGQHGWSAGQYGGASIYFGKAKISVQSTHK